MAKLQKPRTPWDLDLRVRERNVAAGVLDAKQIERSIADLPDLDSHAVPVDIPQPALGRVQD